MVLATATARPDASPKSTATRIERGRSVITAFPTKAPTTLVMDALCRSANHRVVHVNRARFDDDRTHARGDDAHVFGRHLHEQTDRDPAHFQKTAGERGALDPHVGLLVKVAPAANRRARSGPGHDNPIAGVVGIDNEPGALGQPPHIDAVDRAAWLTSDRRGDPEPVT